MFFVLIYLMMTKNTGMTMMHPIMKMSEMTDEAIFPESRFLKDN